jgi:hypothetical protein
VTKALRDVDAAPARVVVNEQVTSDRSPCW